MPPHKSVIPIDAKGEVGTEPELPAFLTGFLVGAVQHVFRGGTKFEDVDFYVLEAAMGWGGEMCTARSNSVGVMDVPEVVVHPGMEGEHGLAHIVLVAPGTLDGVDEVIRQAGDVGVCPVFLFVGKATDGAGSVQERTILTIRGLAVGVGGGGGQGVWVIRVRFDLCPDKVVTKIFGPAFAKGDRGGVKLLG